MHTIYLDFQYTERELFQRSVLPYLETNRLRPRVRAIQKTRPIAYRAKVLGRALLSARTDANRFWMLLSGNAEVAFPPRTTTIVAATNLPTSTTATATAASAAATTNVAAITAFGVSASTATVPGSVPTAAAAAATSSATPSTASASDTFASTAATNAAPPSTGQKRKLRP
jgi:hypothetical protein